MLPTYELSSHSTFPKDSFYNQDPATLSNGAMINVSVLLDDLDKRVFESRIFKQGGRFYIAAADKCNVPLNKQPAIAVNLFRFRIPADRKKAIRDELAAVGITRDTLYVQENPDHQRLIDEINKEIYG